MAAARFLAAVAIAALSAACTPAPYQAESRYVERSSKKSPEATEAVCRISLAPVQDERRDRSILGNVAGKTVFAPTAPESWMRGLFAGLESRGIAVQHLAADEAAPPGLHGRPRLIHAWVTNVQTNKSANVVMALEVLRNGDPLLQREYRGSWTGTNWNSSDDEIQKMIDRAFGRLLDSLADDLRPFCPPGGAAAG